MKTKPKVLLMLLPFHPPLIPPLGIACLKAYLQSNGFEVKTVNANRNEELTGFYTQYFDALKRFVPEDRQANFYNIGNEVLRNHLMAYINHTSEELYRESVGILVYNTFFQTITGEMAARLNSIVAMYFAALEKFVLGIVSRERPSVFGLSVFKGTLPSSMFAFRAVKKFAPGIMTVMGGGVFADQLSVGSPDLEVFVERTPYIDKIILGEGEYLFLKLLQGQLPDSQKVYSLKDMDGHFVDVAQMPLPDFSDFDVDYYPYLANYSSRSCPFQCSFCGETVLWGRYRKKRPEQIVSEMTMLRTMYRRRNYLLCDSLLNPTIDRLSDGLRQQGEAIFFDGYLRVDPAVCDVKNTVRWRCGGFYRARLGVESGSQRVLQLMDKRITTRQIEAAVSSLAYAGIKTTTYWIVGYPGETEEDFQNTLDLLTDMKDDIYEAEANPFWYYLNALVKSDDWAEYSMSLYPEEMTEMLLLPTRVLNIPPTPAERYLRLNRFVAHCRQLGIPNPYSLSDIYKADERWKRLHGNSVPALTDFYSGNDLSAFRKMPKESVEKPAVPLSHLQLFRWRLEKEHRDNEGAPRTENVVAELEGNVDAALLKRALTVAFNRHNILRAAFNEHRGTPEQRGGEGAVTSFIYKELTLRPPDGGEAELFGTFFRELEQLLDLEKGPVLATMLCKLGAQRYAVLLSGSCLCLDRHSAMMILQELLQDYERLEKGGEIALTELPPLQYGDYAAWDRGRLSGGDLDHQRLFWSRSLKSRVCGDYLTDDRPGEAAPVGGRVFRLCFSPKLAGDLRKLAKDEDTTTFAVVFAMMGAWLAHVAEEQEIVIGTEFDCRVYPEQQAVVGPMNNLLPVVLDLSGNPGFRHLLRRTRKALSNVDRNRDYPVDFCWQSRGDGISAFPIVFNHHEATGASFRTELLSARPIWELERFDRVLNGDVGCLEFPHCFSHDLRVDMWEPDGKITLFVRHNRQKFQNSFIENHFRHFLSLAEQFVSSPDAHLSQVDSCGESLVDELF